MDIDELKGDGELMKTLDLKEAACMLKMHAQTVRRRALSGEIPAAKPGKCWAFIEEDLANWLRSRYVQPRQVPGQEKTQWRFTKDKGPDFGGHALNSRSEKYANLLGLRKNAKHRSTKQS